MFISLLQFVENSFTHITDLFLSGTLLGIKDLLACRFNHSLILKILICVWQ